MLHFEASRHRVGPSPTARAIRGAIGCTLLALLSASLSCPSALASTPISPTVFAFDAAELGSPAPSNPAVVALAPSAAGDGYYVLRANGEVDAYGVPSYGSLAPTSLPPGSTATGIALDSATGGYWVVTSNGLVRGFNAPFMGEPHIPPGGWGQHPAAVAIAAANNGAGYYVLRANGAVDAFGVTNQGSLGGRLHYGLTAPVVAVAIAVDPATDGYWIATSTGDVANFNAPNDGSPLASADGTYDGVPVSGLATDPAGTGYYVLRADGAIDSFGEPSHGSLAATNALPTGAFASALTVDASTGGYYEAIDFTPLDGYLNPLRSVTSLVPQEVDQGVDYCASGPVYALGNAVVVNLYEPQWPGGVFISYRLSAGPAQGRYVYLAENVTPQVTVGEHVTPTTVVGVMHDATTCIETGWADPPASPERAQGHVEYNGKNSTAFGLNFNSLLQELGARPGLPQPFGPPGPLPSSWPTW